MQTNLKSVLVSRLVISSHRRTEAAKMAGVKTLPCVIVEMSDQEQLETMLLENMQRADLSIVEQAQGFQMMLDLGSDINTISEKTGFSKTTVRHRIGRTSTGDIPLGLYSQDVKSMDIFHQCSEVL